MTAWRISNLCLSTTWPPPDDGLPLTTSWWPPDDCLTSGKWLHDCCLMTTEGLPNKKVEILKNDNKKVTGITTQESPYSPIYSSSLQDPILTCIQLFWEYALPCLSPPVRNLGTVFAETISGGPSKLLSYSLWACVVSGFSKWAYMGENRYKPFKDKKMSCIKGEKRVEPKRRAVYGWEYIPYTVAYSLKICCSLKIDSCSVFVPK